MRLLSIKYNNKEQAAIDSSLGVLPLIDLNRLFQTNWPETIWEILQSEVLDELRFWNDTLSKEKTPELKTMALDRPAIIPAPLYRHPGKIWGIGLNYKDHASDLSEPTPQEIPASFIKSQTTLIGPGEEIHLPLLSEKVTGEAELGLVIGKKVKNLKSGEGLNAIAGFVSIIDMTAEDILRKNPRYLTLSKNFDTFFSLGSQLITPDEIGDLNALQISTVKNGTIQVSNRVRNMTFSPDFLVCFHSRVMMLQPGDIISSGTPGAVALQNGDIIECRLEGFEILKNPVKDLKGE